MPESEPIVCRPTPWFYYRVGAITLMFSVFAVMFYIDGSSGYRKKNKVYYLHNCFEQAGREFSAMNSDQTLTPQAWKEHAASRQVDFPEDVSILPPTLELPMPWPAILQDYDRVKSLQWNQLWLDYSGQQGLDSTPPEQPYDSRKINEQWAFFYGCSALACLSLLLLVRTSLRRITADDEALTSQDGRRVPYGDFHHLDLRKWDNKGIAYADYEGTVGKGRLRIDGLTYGGFKKELGEPAEKLMQRLRSRFTGEILEYSLVEETEPDSSSSGSDSPTDPESSSRS